MWTTAWPLAWHNLQIELARALIVALLVTLIVCYQRLRGPDTSRAEWFTVRLPFSVYLGWVTVATVANTAILLVDAGLAGGPWWGAVALLGAAGIALTMLVRRRDVPFALSAIRALVGIAVAQGGRSGSSPSPRRPGGAARRRDRASRWPSHADNRREPPPGVRQWPSHA